MSVQTQSPVMDSKFLKRKAPLDDEDYEMSQRPVKVFKTLSGQTTRMIAKWRMNLSKTFNTAIQNSLPSPPVDQIDRQFTVAPLATVANEGRVYRLLPTRLRRPTINETSNTVTPSPDATKSILPTAQHPLSVSEQREPGVSEAKPPATDEGQVVELSEEALKVFDQHQELLSPTHSQGFAVDDRELDEAQEIEASISIASLDNEANGSVKSEPDPKEHEDALVALSSHSRHIDENYDDCPEDTPLTPSLPRSMSDLRSLTPLPEVNDTAEAKEARDLTARLGRCTLGAIPRPPQIPAMPLFERLEDKSFWDENTTKDTAVAGASVNAEENHLPRSVHFADLEEAAEDATESPEPSTVELSVPSEQVQVSGDPLSDNTRTPRPRRRNEATYSDSSRRSTRDLVLQSRQNIEQQEPADFTHVAQARRKARHSVTPYDSVQRHPRKSILRPPRSSHCEPSPEIPLPAVLPVPNTLSNDEVSETSLGSVESKLNPITAMFKRLMDGLRAKGQVWKKPTVVDPRLVNGRRPHEIAHTPTPSAFDDAPPQLAAESPHSSQEADTALDQSPPALESHPLRSITHIERSMDDLDSSVDEVAMSDVSGQMDSDGRNSWSPHSSSQCSVWGPSTFTRSDAPLESSTWNAYREPLWGSPAAFSQSSSYREDSRLNGEEDAMDVDDW